jgi:hypothetical protein
VVTLLAVGAALWALLPGPPPALVPLTAARAAGDVLFDTDDVAFVDVLALRAGGAEVLFHSATAGAKGALGTGDDRYRLAADAPVVVVVASPLPLQDMDRVAAGLDVVALDDLGARLRERYAGAAVAVLR